MSFREKSGYQKASFQGNSNKACEERAEGLWNTSVSVLMLGDWGDWDFW